MRAPRRSLIASLTVLLLASCATTPDGPPPPAPTAGEPRVEVGDQSLTSLTLKVALPVTNPRGRPLRVEEVRYALTRDGQFLREGKAELDLTVPPGDTRAAVFQVAVERLCELSTLAELPPAVQLILEGEAVGTWPEADGEAAAPPSTVPFVRRVPVRSPRLPKVVLASADAARQRLDAVAVDIRLEVVNDNPFPVRVSRLDYDLEIEDTVLASGRLAESARLPASARLRYELPVSLTEESLPGLKRLLQEKNALDYRLQGTLAVGDLRIPVAESAQLTFSSER